MSPRQAMTDSLRNILILLEQLSEAYSLSHTMENYYITFHNDEYNIPKNPNAKSDMPPAFMDPSLNKYLVGKMMMLVEDIANKYPEEFGNEWRSYVEISERKPHNLIEQRLVRVNIKDSKLAEQISGELGVGGEVLSLRIVLRAIDEMRAEIAELLNSVQEEEAF
jgi:hypothetical protein